jgi:hypothetical protein
LSLSYYMDHHVRSAITEGLRRRGIDCLTAEEDGAAEAEDEWLLERATGLGRILFSQDVDLLAIASEWLESGRRFSGLVYGRQLGLTVGQAIRDLELIAQVLAAAEMEDHIEFIPL